VTEVPPVEKLDAAALARGLGRGVIPDLALVLVAHPDHAAADDQHVVADQAHHLVDVGQAVGRDQRPLQHLAGGDLDRVAILELGYDDGNRGAGVNARCEDVDVRPEHREFTIAEAGTLGVEVGVEPVDGVGLVLPVAEFLLGVLEQVQPWARRRWFRGRVIVLVEDLVVVSHGGYSAGFAGG
jgi:hypothetical protein